MSSLKDTATTGDFLAHTTTPLGIAKRSGAITAFTKFSATAAALTSTTYTLTTNSSITGHGIRLTFGGLRTVGPLLQVILTIPKEYVCHLIDQITAIKKQKT